MREAANEKDRRNRRNQSGRQAEHSMPPARGQHAPALTNRMKSLTAAANQNRERHQLQAESEHPLCRLDARRVSHTASTDSPLTLQVSRVSSDAIARRHVSTSSVGVSSDAMGENNEER